MGPSRLHRSSLSSTEIGISLCLTQQRVTLWAGKSPPRCGVFSTQDRQLVVPPVHRVPSTLVPAARHYVVTCCDHFPPCRPHSVLQWPSRPCPTKLIYEPGFFKMFAKLVFAESFCVPGGTPHLAAPTHSCAHNSKTRLWDEWILWILALEKTHVDFEFLGTGANLLLKFKDKLGVWAGVGSIAVRRKGGRPYE